MHEKHLFWSYKHVRKLSYLYLSVQKLSGGEATLFTTLYSISFIT